MANNRMYLVYRPTNEGVYLGKRYGGVWFDAPLDLGEKLNSLFTHIGVDGNNDEFRLRYEADPFFGPPELTWK